MLKQTRENNKMPRETYTEDDAKYKLREPNGMDFWNIREKMAGEDAIRS